MFHIYSIIHHWKGASRRKEVRFLLSIHVKVTALKSNMTNNAWNSQNPAQVARGCTGLNTITAHNVIIGDNSNAMKLIAPHATVGIPLVSQGIAADPAYNTAVVAGGGTGRTSFTPYTVICGGTTTQGNLQHVFDVGAAGNVLTSNGPGALPTWQPASSGGFNIKYPFSAKFDGYESAYYYSYIRNNYFRVGSLGGFVIEYQDGTAFNDANGLFTAPEDGYYQFNFNINAGRKSFLYYLSEDNDASYLVDRGWIATNPQISFSAWEITAPAFTISSSIIVFLNAGNKRAIMAYDYNLVGSAGYNFTVYFSGYYVHA